jgi:LmbE family N-acetylglucosaminyl deacetylase
MPKTLLLSEPLTFDLRTIDTLAAPVLVVAPHPDDETLGCGGTIALLRSRHHSVHILVMSDGTRSHPHSQRYPAPALRSLRQRETCHAMSILGVPERAIHFLNLSDSAVPAATSPSFLAAVHRCRTYFNSLPPFKTILVPWRYDPHGDHRASYQIIKAAASPSVRLLEYPIWDWDEQQRGSLPQSIALTFWRLDIRSVGALKQQAISAYRSQTTDLIDDDPTGFRLTSEMLEHFKAPWEIFIEETPIEEISAEEIPLQPLETHSL